jgi:hypothetical protein
MILLACVVAAFFGAWLGLTVAYQFVPLSPRWARHLSLLPRHVIPKWTFFAPSPSRLDFRVVFQDCYETGTPAGTVQEIVLHESRSAGHAVWNPNKRIRKAIFDMTQVLLLDPLRTAGPNMQIATPYLAILNIVMAQEPTSLAGRYRRFFIVATTGFKGDEVPIVVFTSYIHPRHNQEAGE